MVCKGIKPRARPAKVIRAGCFLFKDRLVQYIAITICKSAYICVLPSGADTLRIRECTFAGVALCFQLAGNSCCQSSILCKGLLTDVAKIGREGETWQREKDCTTYDGESHDRGISQKGLTNE